MNENWAGNAACRGLDPAVFYPVTEDEAEIAKAIFADWPVVEPCLEHAITNREKNGVWGGATERERLRIIRRRRRIRAQVSGLAS